MAKPVLVRRWAIGLSLGVGLGCGAEPGGGSDGPRPLAIQLVTPNSNDGAVLFEVVGPGLDSITGPPAQLVVQKTDRGALVIATGSLTTGPLARLWAAGNASASAFQASVIQVAQRGSYQQRPTTGYRLTIAP